eukprot:g27874.t1
MMSGNSIEIQIAPPYLVKSVKERLEAKLGIPAFLQRIVAEIELEDGDNVSTHLGPEDGSTHLTMIRKDPPCITTEEFLKTIVFCTLALSPEFSFFGQMLSQNPRMEPRFSVFLAQNEGVDSVISFGGHEEKFASGHIQWVPVAMSKLGYWQVELKDVKIGDQVLEECRDGSCRAILDTGTSLLGVPRQVVRSMHRMLARPIAHQPGIDCRRLPGLQLDFEMEGGVMSLSPEDYSRPLPFNMTMPNQDKWRLFCRSLLLPVEMAEPLGPKVFIWGEPVLRRYYTIYDLANKRIGLTLAKQPTGQAASPASVGTPPAGSLLSGSPLSPVPEVAVNVA